MGAWLSVCPPVEGTLAPSEAAAGQAADSRCLSCFQMTGRYAEYAEELAEAVGHDFRPNLVKEF